MTTTNLLTTLATVILGGGFVGGIVALVKLKPEGDQILVSSAKDVVLIQKGALEDLRQQMDDLEARLKGQLDTALLAQRTAEETLIECQRAYRETAARVEALESEVSDLRQNSGPVPVVTPKTTRKKP